MRYRLLAVGAVAMLAVAADPPKLGPEWTYDEKMRQYTKTAPMKVVRTSAAVSGQNYYIDLQHDKLRAHDADDKTSMGITLNDSITLEVKNPKGGPPSILYGVYNRCSYHDLNGDGAWDAWYDSRGGERKRHIWRKGSWVQVRDMKAGFGDTPEKSLDEKTEYTWDGKEWQGRAVGR